MRANSSAPRHSRSTFALPGRVLREIRSEQMAFDASLPTLLLTHAGEFVVMKRGRIAGRFSTVADAYAFGIARFGVRVPFLVAEVRVRDADLS
jgi:hypothetical protein